MDIFELIKKRKFTDSYCFLCGIELNSENKTVEHVIPKWIQKKFKLWNQTIELLNKTTIQYRRLTIPCCYKCNNKYLEPFESQISNAIERGYDAFCKLDKEVVFLWLCKIYYGLMYKQLFLASDRSDKKSQNIISAEYVDTFYSLFLFLQGIRNKIIYKEFFPAAIFCFKTQMPEEIEKRWDFIDSHNAIFIAIRIGEVGIIASLQDGEATQQLEEHLDIHKTIELHPLQFRELTAMTMYKTMLMNRIPKYLSSEEKGTIEIYQMPLQGGSDKSIFDDYDVDIYAKILSELTQLPLEDIQPEPKKVWTWLSDENGKPLFIDVKKHP